MLLSTKSKLPAQRIADCYLVIIVMGCLLLTVRGLGRPVAGSLLVLVLLLLPISAWLLAQSGSYHRYRNWLLLIFLSYLGFLLGLQLDFGVAGLLFLASWCSSNSDASVLSLWNKLAITPWSHIGMLLGCNVALLSQPYTGPHCARPIRDWKYILVCNVGMLLGMVVVEAWSPAFSLNFEMLAIIVVLEMMGAMVLGMLSMTWLFDHNLVKYLY